MLTLRSSGNDEKWNVTHKIEDGLPLQTSKKVCEYIYDHGRNAALGDGIAERATGRMIGVHISVLLPYAYPSGSHNDDIYWGLCAHTSHCSAKPLCQMVGGISFVVMVRTRFARGLLKAGCSKLHRL